MPVRRFNSAMLTTASHCAKMDLLDRELRVSKMLNRKWMLKAPDSDIHQIKLSSPYGEQFMASGGQTFSNNTNPALGINMRVRRGRRPHFYVVRDDLLHPLVNGNKARKLDAVLPLLEDFSVTDVITCGGCQSAHTAALAAACAERGIRAHLLLRGERPKILTGYCLMSSMYGDVTYVSRSLYADRNKMLANHANAIAGTDDIVLSCNDLLDTNSRSDEKNIRNFPRKVVIINEGAGDVASLLGVFRLVMFLSQDHVLGREKAVNLVVDAGTGTTAIGLGLAAVFLQLPWKITAVVLADTIQNYTKKEKELVTQFSSHFLGDSDLEKWTFCNLINWIDRSSKRKFGNILEGEVESCSKIAKQTGILVDPVYTLAAWEESVRLSLGEREEDVVMLHTGGTLGMLGVAQRYDMDFRYAKL